MQKNPNDRSLTGQEQQQERIVVKRAENSIKKIEFEIEINKTEAERLLEVENAEKKLQIANLTERRDKGKQLINGAKISDVFPPKPAPEVVPEEKHALNPKTPLEEQQAEQEKKGKGGGKVEAKV